MGGTASIKKNRGNPRRSYGKSNITARPYLCQDHVLQESLTCSPRSINKENSTSAFLVSTNHRLESIALIVVRSFQASTPHCIQMLLVVGFLLHYDPRDVLIEILKVVGRER